MFCRSFSFILGTATLTLAALMPLILLQIPLFLLGAGWCTGALLPKRFFD